MPWLQASGEADHMEDQEVGVSHGMLPYCGDAVQNLDRCFAIKS